MNSDYITFWMRNNARPVWTDSDWAKYEIDTRAHLFAMVTNAVNRYLAARRAK